VLKTMKAGRRIAIYWIVGWMPKWMKIVEIR
jgi:hypothetical protein